MKVYRPEQHIPALLKSLAPRHKSYPPGHPMRGRDDEFYPPDVSGQQTQPADQDGDQAEWTRQMLLVISEVFRLTSNAKSERMKKLNRRCKRILDNYRPSATDADGGSVDPAPRFGPQDQAGLVKGLRGVPGHEAAVVALFMAEREAQRRQDAAINKFFGE